MIAVVGQEVINSRIGYTFITHEVTVDGAHTSRLGNNDGTTKSLTSFGIRYHIS